MDNRYTAQALVFMTKAILFLLENVQWKNGRTQAEINVHIRRGEEVIRGLNGHY